MVILLDEYDKLIVDNLDQPEVARQGREVLKDLYTTIKDNIEKCLNKGYSYNRITFMPAESLKPR